MGYPIGQNELRKKKSWLQILNLNQGKFGIKKYFKFKSKDLNSKQEDFKIQNKDFKSFQK
jgi:hypothetical protein